MLPWNLRSWMGFFTHRHLLLWAPFLHFGAFAIYMRAGSSCPGSSSVPAFIELSLPAGAWFWTSNVLVAKPLFYLHTSVKYKVEIDLLNMFWTKQCLFKVICEEFNFIEIPLQHGCSHVNLLHIFRTPFPRNTSGWLLLQCTSFCARLKKIEHCPENWILHLCFFVCTFCFILIRLLVEWKQVNITFKIQFYSFV